MTENTITCTDFYSLEENIIRNFTANNKLDVLAHTLKVRDNALILAKNTSSTTNRPETPHFSTTSAPLFPLKTTFLSPKHLIWKFFPQKGNFRHFCISGFRVSSPWKPSMWSTRKF